MDTTMSQSPHTMTHLDNKMHVRFTKVCHYLIASLLILLGSFFLFLFKENTKQNSDLDYHTFSPATQKDENLSNERFPSFYLITFLV
jgi:hypothetical protein